MPRDSRAASAAAPDPSPAAAAALRGFGQRVGDAPRTGVLGTLLMAVPTFGVLPALIWPLRFNHAAAAEREQFRNLAEWARLNSRHPAAAQLGAAAATVRPSSLLNVLLVFTALGVVGSFFGVHVAHGIDFDALLASTYAFPRVGRSWFGPPQAVRENLFILWSAGLSVAYVAHWLQVHVYARRVRRFLDLFNVVAIHEGLSPVFLPPVGTGIRPFWTLAAAAVVIFGHALWGIPLALAGAVQRRYGCKASPAARAALGGRLRDMLLLRRPLPPFPVTPGAMAALPSTSSRDRIRCATPVCRQPLPPGSRFCTRCGARVIPTVDRLA